MAGLFNNSDLFGNNYNFSESDAAQLNNPYGGETPTFSSTSTGALASPPSIDPQLAAIIASISGTPGASGNIGGTQYGANPTAPGAPGGGATGGQQAGANPWMNNAPFGGTSPWMQNVTAGTVDTSGAPSGNVNFASPGNPNVNYLTKDAGSQIAKMFGANLLGQNLQGMGPAGAPSAPMYGLDFGAGDAQNAGQVAYWMQRGDSPGAIMARLQAGIAPPLGVGNRDGQGFNYDYKNPVASNLGQGQVSSFVPGSTGGAAFNPTGYFQGATPSTHLGVQGGVPEQARSTQPGNSAFGLSGGNGTSNQGFANPNNMTGYQNWGNQRSQLGGFQGNGNMTGYANFSNGASRFGRQRQPSITGQGGSFGNQWYYPGYEPNMQGGTGTYANTRRGFNTQGSNRY